MTGHHSGDIGDIIYAIPAMRMVGVSGLSIGKDNRYRTTMTSEGAQALKPLLESQGFAVTLGERNGDALDLNAYRDGSQDLQCAHLSRAQANSLGVNVDLTRPYLSVAPLHAGDLIIHRSPRYHGSRFDWPALLDGFDPVMVGLRDEWEAMEQLLDRKIEYRPVLDFHEMARIIRGAKAFVGNQSAPFAIAEGLKANRIQETCRWVVNAVPQTVNGVSVLQPGHQAYARARLDEWMSGSAIQSETSLIRPEVIRYCRGKIIDLGCGGDKIVPGAIGFDLAKPYTRVGTDAIDEQGDARDLSRYEDGAFDVCFSSHLLEDFEDTETVLDEWLRVLKPGGHLILYLPHERRFRAHCEGSGQGYNKAHKVEKMSLEYMLEILARKPVVPVHTIESHAKYSFLVVVRKI